MRFDQLANFKHMDASRDRQIGRRIKAPWRGWEVLRPMAKIS